MRSVYREAVLAGAAWLPGSSGLWTPGLPKARQAETPVPHSYHASGSLKGALTASICQENYGRVEHVLAK